MQCKEASERCTDRYIGLSCLVNHSVKLADLGKRKKIDRTYCQYVGHWWLMLTTKSAWIMVPSALIHFQALLPPDNPIQEAFRPPYTPGSFRPIITQMSKVTSLYKRSMKVQIRWCSENLKVWWTNGPTNKSSQTINDCRIHSNRFSRLRALQPTYLLTWKTPRDAYAYKNKYIVMVRL